MIGFGQRTRTSTSGTKRKAERSKTFASAIVETPASRHDMTIIDISPYGARVSGTLRSVTRRELRVRVNEVDLFGTVVWRKDDMIGLRFDEILSNHNTSEICQAVLAAEAYSRQFDREASLQALANRPGGGSQISRLAEARGTAASRPAS